MKKIFLLLTISVALISCDPKVLEGIMSGEVPTSKVPLTNEEVIRGLKEALNVGAKNAVSFTGKVNGFTNDPLIRIPFPEEGKKVKDAALKLGFTNEVAQFEATLNKAAEQASAEAYDVFVQAITGMSVQDGFAILKGDSIAATTFLKQRTTQDLTNRFTPIVQKAVDNTKLTSYWEPLVKAYNTSNIFTGGNDVNPDLTAYVTAKALDGLFLYVSKEEQKIRKDPAARVTAILQRVFGS
jgi:hypothetical protein